MPHLLIPHQPFVSLLFSTGDVGEVTKLPSRLSSIHEISVFEKHGKKIVHHYTLSMLMVNNCTLNDNKRNIIALTCPIVAIFNQIQNAI